MMSGATTAPRVPGWTCLCRECHGEGWVRIRGGVDICRTCLRAAEAAWRGARPVGDAAAADPS